MLRTDAFAFAALEAFGCFRMIHGIALIVHAGLLPGHRMQVQKAEVVRNIYADWALLQAVLTAGARNLDRAVKHIGNLFYKILFRIRKQEGWPVTI